MSRSQQSIARPGEVSGIGFLPGADVRLRFLQAPPHAALSFVRTDLTERVEIPARVEFTAPRSRRTALEWKGVNIEMIEHVMAALAGLRVDNCVVEIDATEPPGCDGSSLAFVECLLEAGIVDQGESRPMLTIQQSVVAGSPDGSKQVDARRGFGTGLIISYDLDYGPDSPIPAQSRTVEITPETFIRELAFARTFVLEAEAQALRAMGYGRRTTARDLLIYGAKGVIDNELRAADECVRHKLLDCVGDFALIGCDLSGRIDAFRSGHRLNAEIVQRLKLAHPQHFFREQSRAA